MVSLWRCGQFWDGVAFHVWTWTLCHTCHREDRGWGGQLQCVSLDLSFGWQSFHSRDTATHCCQLSSLEKPLDRQWLQGKNAKFKAFTLFGKGIDHLTSKTGWTIDVYGRQSNAFEGLFWSWSGQKSDKKGKDTGQYKCECSQYVGEDPASDCGLSDTLHTSST